MHGNTPTAVSVWCLLVGTEAVIESQCHSATWRQNQVPINSPSPLFCSSSFSPSSLVTATKAWHSLICFHIYLYYFTNHYRFVPVSNPFRKRLVWSSSNTAVNVWGGYGVLSSCDTWNPRPSWLTAYSHISHYRHIKHVLALLCHLEDLDYIIYCMNQIILVWPSAK